MTHRVNVGGNAWKRCSQAHHFCSLAFQALRSTFFHWNARYYAGKIVLSFINEVNLNLIKITASLDMQGAIKKTVRAHRFLPFPLP